ncbi:MAG: hypothetical protein H7233_12960, partial [Pseudorhodobacter sp.]|nr:hypothetical protein [Frankiaceae bacterium]
MAQPWIAPSARVVELMRRAAAEALADGAMFASMTDESVAVLVPGILDDPTLAASMRAMTRGLVTHWLGQVLVDPGVPVRPAQLSSTLGYVHDVHRRGYDTSAMTTYHTGHNLAWHHWMVRCFGMTDDIAVLRELLEYSDRSISAFVLATMSDVGRAMRAQRWVQDDTSNEERLAYVKLVLNGTVTSVDAVASRLSHDVRPHQTAAVFWHDPSLPPGDRLRRAAGGVAGAAGLGRPLVVVASTVSLWAWFATPAAPDLRELPDAAREHPEVRVAVGSTSRGLDGFRQSHADALTTQRLMFRARTELRWASYDEVRVASLVSADVPGAHEFVSRALGALAGAGP